MRVALVSDTHIPGTASSIPGWVADRLGGADHVVHAGDFITAEAHFEVRVLAGGSLTAVRGNRDRGVDLPGTATLEAGGVRFVVAHGNGLGRGEAYRRGLAALAKDHDADVAVGGHTHRPLEATVDGIRVLNPGSATGADPADGPTLLTVDCEGDTPSVTRHG